MCIWALNPETQGWKGVEGIWLSSSGSILILLGQCGREAGRELTCHLVHASGSTERI